MPSVTLSWDDPEDAREFKRICRDLKRGGPPWDADLDELLELVRDSKITDPGVHAE